jgi:hypothetical protein
MRPGKKLDRSIGIANPDLGGACIEIESAFFVDLRREIGTGCRAIWQRFRTYGVPCFPVRAVDLSVSAGISMVSTLGMGPEFSGVSIIP